MGCRPSRHSSGRVGDSSWRYNKDGFQDGSKKKKTGKSGSSSQKKPTEFCAFSSTTKTYQRTMKDIAQCSKITVRLSTDGSVLEIEKYDIDFHSNKATLFTKDMEWHSRHKPSHVIVDVTRDSTCLRRCGSAPQFDLPHLSSISEENYDTVMNLNEHKNGYTQACVGSKVTKTIKKSKTFVSDRLSKNVVHADISSSGMTVVDIDSLTNKITPGVAKLVHGSINNNCKKSQYSASKQTTIAKETSLNTLNDCKSIIEEEMPSRNSAHFDFTKGQANSIGSCTIHKVVCVDEMAETAQGDMQGIKSSCRNPCSSINSSEETEISDLRTSVYNSINKFNEFLSRRETKRISTATNDDTIIVHNSENHSNHSDLTTRCSCHKTENGSQSHTEVRLESPQNELKCNIGTMTNNGLNTCNNVNSEFAESAIQVSTPEDRRAIDTTETDLLLNVHKQTHNEVCTLCGCVIDYSTMKDTPAFQNRTLSVNTSGSQSSAYLGHENMGVVDRECPSKVQVEKSHSKHTDSDCTSSTTENIAANTTDTTQLNEPLCLHGAKTVRENSKHCESCDTTRTLSLSPAPKDTVLKTRCSITNGFSPVTIEDNPVHKHSISTQSPTVCHGETSAMDGNSKGNKKGAS